MAKNTFDIGILDLEVYHKKGNDYQKVTADTKIFDDEAIYEPGYTQVVRLKIENKGNMDFRDLDSGLKCYYQWSDFRQINFKLTCWISLNEPPNSSQAGV